MSVDTVGHWAAGPHYGPVLTPTDLYILGNKLELHPILQSADNSFQLLFNVATGQTGGLNMSDRNRDLPFTQKDEPATLPRMTEIVIISHHSPWTTTIRNEHGVTLADVCTTLWKDYTENPITDAEFNVLPPRWQDNVRRYAMTNQQAMGNPYGANGGRLRRCDWLRDKTWFESIHTEEKYVRDRLGFSAPNIFVLDLAA
ncbi:hypothetical protein SISNIDRAFT_403903 [Sistotremastrum niveocremeum HHB9708]|uniref:DUF6699 domain-containing protein n=2 Tax=Sistotremastraceae TaxID=3402574 RepID=A0A165AB73_9AGAM|nr:hypothetical protein SISNIDRAFT_403903 [Sistotremastrum niveocremeum HHB9708]KZT36356.1 hypothetical protein SISSUDRAFT_989372 [Sistotremastrum suecicum HHB10207 ss-3]